MLTFFSFVDEIFYLILLNNPKYISMRFRKLIVNIIVFFFLFLPLIMWGWWLLTPKKHLKVLIVDKTVLTTDGKEHRSFNWVLKYKRFVKENGEYYNIGKDYMGFFPKDNKQYEIHDLKDFSEKQIDSISNYYDMVYYTDTYGIYYNEWYLDTLENELSRKVYGGLDENDYLLLKRMKERNKLVIGEFNLFASPSCGALGKKVEALYRLQWSGWSGRYFATLDTLKNPELPMWIVHYYKRQHGNQWPFKKAGLVFVNVDAHIEVLEKDRDLTFEGPMVNTFLYAQDRFNLPDKIFYPFWFDITYSLDSTNEILAYYQLFPNARGDSILKAYNIPTIFPVAYEHVGGYPFYYFCGDFCDHYAKFNFVQLKGIWYAQILLLENKLGADGKYFFTKYYIPMVNRILQDYYKNRIQYRE